ncbi:hypothetical protein F0562_022974 [Nyssa sinensis]|uniref:MAR-binding filament-like protein 1-1 n=1 Tax=Nyssa sinensis TaxID=561372 RepID=A0A5J5BJ93_9ASTE|nr:hypothetical protein F0562_022974 [Nyssa sinensis]
MGFVTGSSSLLPSPLHHSIFPTSSSLPCSSQSVFLNSCSRNEDNKKNRIALACMHHESPNDSGFCQRRAILFVGISVLPLLKLQAKSLEGSATVDLISEAPIARTPEDNQKAEQSAQGDASPNPFVSLLNGLGIFSSCMLGALYALAQKEKIATEAAIEFIKTKLKEKEAAIASLEKNFESKLLNEQEERLGKQLQSEKRLIEELKVQIDGLKIDLTKAGEDKEKLEEDLKEKINTIAFLQDKINLLTVEIKEKEDNVHKLSSTLAEKELGFKKLKSIYEQIKNELRGANSKIKGLKDELLKNEKEIESKNAVVDDLNTQVSSLIVERDNSNRNVDAIRKEYSDLKFSAEKKAASDAKLLGEREHELHQLKEQLELALKDVSRNQVSVADLSRERDDLKKMLNFESNGVKNLKHELQIAQETLGKSRNEVSDLERQLHQSRNLCSKLEAEVSKVWVEFAEAKELLQRSLDEAKRSGEVLAGELTSAKEVLKKTKDELQIVSRELATAAENRDSLQKELKELQALDNQILKDKESRRYLETDLEEATKSLDEMNRNALILSRDLEVTNSTIASLEDEKEILYRSLAEQKQVSQATRETMEDAHNLVMRLGKGRENLEKRANKLEEELASAKGEILRLRSETNLSRTLINDQHKQKGESEGTATVPVKKRRMRKGGPQ